MKTTLNIIFILLFHSCFGQNIIPNPGFEEVTGCPGSSVFLQNTNHWHRISDHFGTPDQFHADCDYNGLENSMAPGQRPYDGVGYAGQFCFGDNLREYMTVRFCEPMIKDSLYDVEFYVLPAIGYGTMIDSYGVHFSSSEPKGVGGSSLATIQLDEHVGNPIGQLITDTVNWTKISGVYKAKGGERYATFGNFRTDTETNSKVIKENCVRSDRSYMLIDGVSTAFHQEITGAKGDTLDELNEWLKEFESRKLSVRYEYKTKQEKIELLFWDHLREDGDVIVVTIDDTVVLDHYQISNKKERISIDLEHGEHILKMYAVNLGDIPPNTCSIRVSDGRYKRTFILNSDLGNTEAIRIMIK